MPDEVIDIETTEQVDKFIPNPNGKGGFKDNPQNINPGGRPRNLESFSYWINRFKMMTVGEFKEWEKTNPEKTRTVAASLAYARVVNARASLKEFKEIADRTEGRPTQRLVHEGIDSLFNASKLQLEIVDSENKEENEAEEVE